MGVNFATVTPRATALLHRHLPWQEFGRQDTEAQGNTGHSLVGRCAGELCCRYMEVRGGDYDLVRGRLSGLAWHDSCRSSYQHNRHIFRPRQTYLM